jgi:hypothetical protein
LIIALLISVANKRKLAIRDRCLRLQIYCISEEKSPKRTHPEHPENHTTRCNIVSYRHSVCRFGTKIAAILALAGELRVTSRPKSLRYQIE